jgi:hypothetical protein
MTRRESSATERALDRLVAGGTITDAAAAEGISRSTLVRALRRRGEPPRKPPGGPGRPRTPLPEPYYFHDGTPLKSKSALPYKPARSQKVR